MIPLLTAAGTAGLLENLKQHCVTESCQMQGCISCTVTCHALFAAISSRSVTCLYDMEGHFLCRADRTDTYC